MKFAKQMKENAAILILSTGSILFTINVVSDGIWLKCKCIIKLIDDCKHILVGFFWSRFIYYTRARKLIFLAYWVYRLKEVLHIELFGHPLYEMRISKACKTSRNPAYGRTCTILQIFENNIYSPFPNKLPSSGWLSAHLVFGTWCICGIKGTL